MKILAIETATSLGGLAIMDSELGLMAEVRLDVKATHSERLMSEVHYVLEHSGLSVKDIDAIAISIGPGAFTGLRIGLATAKGLAFATGAKLLAVPTLKAYALCFANQSAKVCTMLDARKKQVYAGVYEVAQSDAKVFMDDNVISAKEIAHKLVGKGAVFFAGSGADVYKEDIIDIMGKDAMFAPAHLNVPSAASVATLALRMAKAGLYADPVSLSPAYIRRSEAEDKAGAQ